MPVCARRSLFVWLLLSQAGGCGGTTVADRPEVATDDAAIPKPDAGSWALDAGEGGQGAGGAPWADAGGSCVIPVGTPAPGCPMLLAAACEWLMSSAAFGSDCELPAIFGPTVEPGVLEYIDVQLAKGSERGRLVRVAGAAACSSAGNGWYFDDPASPTKVHVCPSACECAKSEQATLELVTGCWTNAAPGVHDSAMACPRCAQDRPPSCSAWKSGVAHILVECDFPLAAGFDPVKTNLKYVQHASVVGPEEPWDGYLTFVSSLADCDKVEEGWTLDMSTEPATVRVCPTACACAKVNAGELAMESGCPRHELGDP